MTEHPRFRGELLGYCRPLLGQGGSLRRTQRDAAISAEKMAREEIELECELLDVERRVYGTKPADANVRPRDCRWWMSATASR